MIWVGIIGAKGYFGETLARLVAGHPEAQVSTVMELQELGEVSAYMRDCSGRIPGYSGIVNAIKKSDIIFNGLSGKSAKEVYAKALSNGKRIIDISDGCSFKNYIEGSCSAYPGSVYGLHDFYKDKMKNAAVASNPSSYCAGAILGLAPLAANKLGDINTAVIESKSGIASLRRADVLKEAGMLGSGIKTYKMNSMDYEEEVKEQMLAWFGVEASTSYDAYIIPGTKGITTTIKVNPNSEISSDSILDAYREFYNENPFVEVCSTELKPEAINGPGRRFCKIAASKDSESGKITVATVLDDAVRGAAVQAVQTMNLMYGIDGKLGL